MTVYEVLETYCKNCAHNGNCWKPCAAVNWREKWNIKQ